MADSSNNECNGWDNYQRQDNDMEDEGCLASIFKDTCFGNQDGHQQIFAFIVSKLIENHYHGTSDSMVRQVKAVLKKFPAVLHATDDEGRALIHIAATSHRNFTFCKMFIEMDADLVKIHDNTNSLPIHHSCYRIDIETTKYLYELLPESINIPNSFGQCPIHLLVSGYCYEDEPTDAKEMTSFLLKYDRGAVSKPDEDGNLPLHDAIVNCLESDVVKLVFNSYPEAIFVENNQEMTPVDIARSQRYDALEDVVSLIENQLDFERQAREVLTPDENGQLPIHIALQNPDVLAGTIKLMLKANPTGVTMVDSSGLLPLHIALQSNDFDAVKCLIDAYEDSIKVGDTRGNLPLHIACFKGNCNVINYILEKSDHGVSRKNANKKLPIELLLFDAECERNSLDYVEAIRNLFQANPDDAVKCLMGKCKKNSTDDKRDKKRRRGT